MNKILYILLAHFLFLTSCADYEFQKSEQNKQSFTKTVSIEDLVFLTENSSKSVFGEQLQIEATLIGTDDGYMYLSDNSKYGLRVKSSSTADFSIGDLIGIPVGGLNLNRENHSFALSGTPILTLQGQGVTFTNNILLAELESNLILYSSKLVGISELTNITYDSEGVNGNYYTFNSGESEAILFLPDYLEYEIPEELVSVVGFVRVLNNKPVIHLRSINDITEVYVEPLMIEKIMNNSTLVKTLVQNNEVEIAPGVKYAQFSYMNTDNLVTSGSLFEIDLNNPNVKIEVGSPNNAAPPYTAIQPLATMAAHKNTTYANTGWRVLAAMTGDFYNASSPYTLNGPFVRNGSILKSDFISTTDNFFGQLKNGEGFVVGGRTEFDQVKNNLEQAAGGRVILQNGNVNVVTAIREPRPAIGYTASNKVYMFVGNGRLLSVSNGYTPVELANLLKALGCVGGVYLNGGGATVGVLENSDGVYDKFSQSHATNLNHNPSLASSWMIVTKR